MLVPSKIVVAGSGIIGNSIAYYLAKNHNTPVTLIDAVGLAPAASGKSAGFLARDWSDGTAIQHLQRHSFDLHVILAQDFGASTIDFRRLSSAAVAVDGGMSLNKPRGKKLESVEWADVGVMGSRPMGDHSTIAQVHPKKLCNALFNYAQDKVGTELKIGRVLEAVLDSSNKISGVKLESGEILEADALVVACGPWTDEANSWFGDISTITTVLGQKYHSILIKSPRILSQAVFFEGAGDPEVYVS